MAFSLRRGRIDDVETQANGSEVTLAGVLVRRARQASDGRLVIDAAGGLVVTALAIAFRPPGWAVLLSAAVSLMAFGMWGISDRAAQESERPRLIRALKAFRAVAAALGALGGVALAATTMALMLGTWIS